MAHIVAKEVGADIHWKAGRERRRKCGEDLGERRGAEARCCMQEAEISYDGHPSVMSAALQHRNSSGRGSGQDDDEHAERDSDGEDENAVVGGGNGSEPCDNCDTVTVTVTRCALVRVFLRVRRPSKSNTVGQSCFSSLSPCAEHLHYTGVAFNNGPPVQASRTKTPEESRLLERRYPRPSMVAPL